MMSCCTCICVLYYTFLLTSAGDRNGVGCERGLDLGVHKMEHLAVIPDHIHLLYALNWVDPQLLERAL